MKKPTEKQREANRARLKRLLSQYSISVNTLAELLGVQPQTIYTWTMGRAPVPPYCFKLIELTYGK